jgi:ribonuclease P protein component
MDARWRLRKREDFARLRQRGKVYRHALVHLSVIQNELTHCRFGYITGKSVGNAVQRNRVRRLLREAVRLRVAEFAGGFDVLLIARSGLVGQDWLTVVRILETLFRQAGLLRTNHGEESGTGSDPLL